MADPNPAAPPPAASAPDIRAVLMQTDRRCRAAEAEALKLQGQVMELVDMLAASRAALTRQEEEATAALTDRDLAHSQHVAALEADIARLHETIRQQGLAATGETSNG